ncbi:signal recognition particle protein [Clostridiaceae bacterium HSG29]|nr:signal recognition particle protein [Clostridiaceae bacterium HSG29]
MLDNLSEKLQETFKKLKGRGKLNEKDVNAAMREVKLALLEADVNFKIVKEFIKVVKDRSIGVEVLESLSPGQQVIKIVNEELTNLMGETVSKIEYSSNTPSIIMMVGLQGAGKTTTTGKISRLLKEKDHKKPLLVACDVYRPAAIKQLKIVGEQLDVPVFSMGDKVDPVNIAKASIEYAKKNQMDLVILDTAGRLHIDETLMDELVNIKREVEPKEILLVVDSMTGQDAVNVAKNFDEKLEITGVVLTKLDGDTRGGAALSVRKVTGKPIKLIGVGEKLDQIEEFYPDRMASRILGMGDVLTLIEKAQKAFDEDKAMELQKKIKNKQFDFEDFLDQMEQMRNMGSMSDILKMIPGMNSKALKGVNVDEKELDKIQAIIRSMTPAERKNDKLINGSRKKRIAAGSGTTARDVNKLLKQFKESKKMMQQMSSMKGMGKMFSGGGMNLPF